MAYETFEDIVADLRASSIRSTTPPAAFRARISQPITVRGSPRPADGRTCSLIPSTPRGALQRTAKRSPAGGVRGYAPDTARSPRGGVPKGRLRRVPGRSAGGPEAEGSDNSASRQHGLAFIERADNVTA